MKLKREIKIGIYVVVSLILLYLMINFLKGRNIFANETTYYTMADNVQGLKQSSPVYLRGLKIGRIENITFIEKKGVFSVKMRVDSEFAIPLDSRAVIFTSDIMGTKAVQIEMGNSTSFFESGGKMDSKYESAFTTTIAHNIETLRDKADTLVSQLNLTFTNVNKLFDDEAVGELKKSIKNLSSITTTLNSSTQRLDKMLHKNEQKISNIILNVDSIGETVRVNSSNISNTLTNMAQFSEKINQINIDAFVTELDALILSLNEGKGSLGKLIKNDSLYNQLNQAAENLELLLHDIKEHPKRYVHFSVFGGKKKNN